MQKDTINPLEILDRAFREILPDADGVTPRTRTEKAPEEPLEVLRSLGEDDRYEPSSPDPAQIAAAPAIHSATALQRAEGLPIDPLEALRLLERTMPGFEHSEPAPSHENEKLPISADALQALKSLEQTESNLWARSGAEGSTSDEQPEMDTLEARIDPPAEPRMQPPQASRPETDSTKASRTVPSTDEPRMAARAANPAPETVPPIVSSPSMPAPGSPGLAEAARPLHPPIRSRTTHDALASGPASSLGLADPAKRPAQPPERAPRSHDDPAKGTRLFAPPPRFMKSRPRPALEPLETKPAQDPGAEARAAFYRARQELGDDASLDEIIARACTGLDRNAREILFEIQLKILLGNS